MHRAGKRADQAMLLQGRQRVGRDPVLRVEDVEAAMGGDLEIGDVVLDPLLDHRGKARRSRHRGDARRFAKRFAEEAGARHIRRMHHGLVPETHQSVAEFERVHDPAARIGGMGKDRDAKGRPGHAASSAPAQPSSGRTAKSQIVSLERPSVTATLLPVTMPPISAQAMPRAWKRARMAGTSETATDRR